MRDDEVSTSPLILERRFVLWPEVVKASDGNHERIWSKGHEIMEIGETLYVTTRGEFRRWLMEHHGTKKEIWLIQYKKATGKPSIRYADAVEEAICFGWIDGFEKGMDAQRYATRFTPRRPRSHWTETNMQLARKLLAEGKMTAAGLSALPQEVSPGSLRRSKSIAPK